MGLVIPGHDHADLARLESYEPGIEVVECDLRNQEELIRLVNEFTPHEIFNFGGILRRPK